MIRMKMIFFKGTRFSRDPWSFFTGVKSYYSHYLEITEKGLMEMMLEGFSLYAESLQREFNVGKLDLRE